MKLSARALEPNARKIKYKEEKSINLSRFLMARDLHPFSIVIQPVVGDDPRKRAGKQDESRKKKTHKIQGRLMEPMVIRRGRELQRRTRAGALAFFRLIAVVV